MHPRFMKYWIKSYGKSESRKKQIDLHALIFWVLIKLSLSNFSGIFTVNWLLFHSFNMSVSVWTSYCFLYWGNSILLAIDVADESMLYGCQVHNSWRYPQYFRWIALCNTVILLMLTWILIAMSLYHTSIAAHHAFLTA